MTSARMDWYCARKSSNGTFTFVSCLLYLATGCSLRVEPVSADAASPAVASNVS